ncbi:MAG: glycerophosphodiester phosphodiesterase family protein [Niabella sp.]
MSTRMLIMCLWLVSLTACGVSKKSQSVDKNVGLDLQAHRGGRGLMPENTIPAMLHAIDIGITTLEMDMQVTKDRKIVVSHDPNFNANFTTTPEGDTLTKAEAAKRLLYTMPYDSIKKYDVGLKFNREFPRQKKMAVAKPLLSDLLTATEDYAKKKGVSPFYNIEIKSSLKKDGINHPPVEQFTDLAMQTLLPFHLGDRLLIQSFDDRALKIMHKKYPGVKLSLLIEGYDERSLDQQIKDLGFVPEVYSPHYKKLTKELISQCHKMNMRVVPWTINDLETMKELVEMGVDGLISDYPDLYSKLKK